MMATAKQRTAAKRALKSRTSKKDRAGGSRWTNTIEPKQVENIRKGRPSKRKR
jgi:hypothetical protein